VIEPYVSRQWFVSVGPLAKKARAAVADGKTRIVPAQWEKTYFEWMDNIRDWCISRQIWWGHRIPAWTCMECGTLVVSRQDPTECPNCKCGTLQQEEDVLDTWFSSALWPFSTLGWPEQTRELKTFYPTSVLVTGFDILFFWVARMMMMGMQFMNEVPFRDVYIHALVRDAQGKKMSKSTGNVIDPLVMIDRYGTDAFRFTLTAFAAMGRDIKMSEERIEGYRHFINKIWNASRFALMNLPEEAPEGLPSKVEGLANRWILHRLEEIKGVVGRAIEEYRFNDAAQALYQFVWHEFCDWYLEMIKTDLQGGAGSAAGMESLRCLKTALSETLVLLHPIIPFVTQEIWSQLMPQDQGNLARQPFPAHRPEHLDPEHRRAGRFSPGGRRQRPDNPGGTRHRPLQGAQAPGQGRGRAGAVPFAEQGADPQPRPGLRRCRRTRPAGSQGFGQRSGQGLRAVRPARGGGGHRCRAGPPGEGAGQGLQGDRDRQPQAGQRGLRGQGAGPGRREGTPEGR
jgi:valyl-tRNA synthetase